MVQPRTRTARTWSGTIDVGFPGVAQGETPRTSSPYAHRRSSPSSTGSRRFGRGPLRPGERTPSSGGSCSRCLGCWPSRPVSSSGPPIRGCSAGMRGGYFPSWNGELAEPSGKRQSAAGDPAPGQESLRGREASRHAGGCSVPLPGVSLDLLGLWSPASNDRLRWDARVLASARRSLGMKIVR